MWAYTLVIHSFTSKPRRLQKHKLIHDTLFENTSLYTTTATEQLTCLYSIMLHHQPQILSPLVEMDTHSSSSSLRARKMSAGGNRSWSEEEVCGINQGVVQRLTPTRKTIFCKRACKRCHISTLLLISKRPNWPAVCITISCRTVAIAASAPHLFLQWPLAALPASLRRTLWEWTMMTTLNRPAMVRP